MKGTSLHFIEGQIPVFVVFMSGPITALVEKVFFAIELGPGSDCGENERRELLNRIAEVEADEDPAGLQGWLLAVI